MPDDRDPSRRISLKEAVQERDGDGIRTAAASIARVLEAQGLPTSAAFARAIGAIAAAALPIADRFEHHKGFSPDEAERLLAAVIENRPNLRRATH